MNPKPPPAADQPAQLRRRAEDRFFLFPRLGAGDDPRGLVARHRLGDLAVADAAHRAGNASHGIATGRTQPQGCTATPRSRSYPLATPTRRLAAATRGHISIGGQRYILPALTVRRVGDTATRDAFCAIGSVCFHVPLTWFREVFDNRAVWDHFAAYVGYHDQDPVSTAAIVMGGGAIGVYNVATIPDRRRHGYGETVMRHALGEAQREHGMERSILQSSPAGLHLYERMGYRKITRVSVYAS